jgi:hypothetical protein
MAAGILIVGLIVAVGLGAYCLWFVVTAVGLAETFDGRQETRRGGGHTADRRTYAYSISSFIALRTGDGYAMSSSIILSKDADEIQSAMAISLLQVKNAHDLTYDKIGKVIGREKQSVAQYISGGTEMPATCWLKAVSQWPELEARLEYNLEEAEKAFLGQLSFQLCRPRPQEAEAA